MAACQLGVGGDAGAGLPGLDLALDNAARFGHRLLAEPQLDPPVEDDAGQTGPVAEPLERRAVDHWVSAVVVALPPRLLLLAGDRRQQVDDPRPGGGRGGEPGPHRAGLDQGSAAPVRVAEEAIEDQGEEPTLAGLVVSSR